MKNWGRIASAAVIAVAGLVGAGAAYAQGAAELARRALSQVPQDVVAGVEGPIIIGVGNGDAVRWPAVNGAQAGLNPNTPHLFAAQRSAAPLQLDLWYTYGEAEVRAAIGLAPRDWISSYEIAVGPVRLGGMEIHPDSSMRLRGALFAQGYERTERSGVPVMWRGDDLATDPSWVDPANPFGGAEGLATRFAIDDDRMVWATSWPVLDRGLAPFGPNMAAQPEVAALLSGIGRAGNLGAAASVRIWLRNGARLPIVGAEDGPIEGLLLSDHSVRNREAAGMVLLLTPGFDVSGLDTRLAEAWPILHQGPFMEAPSITVTDGAQPTVTISLAGGWGDDGAATNAPYETLQSVLESGRLGFLLSR